MIFKKLIDDFLKTPEITPSRKLSESVLLKINSQMQIQLSRLLYKIFFIHLVATTISIFICPQFKISFTSSMGLSHYFMELGEECCSFLCGSFYIALTVVGTQVFLKRIELNFLGAKEYFIYPVFIVFSLVGFLFFGAKISEIFSFLGFVWFLGALLSSCGLSFLSKSLLKYTNKPVNA